MAREGRLTWLTTADRQRISEELDAAQSLADLTAIVNTLPVEADEDAHILADSALTVAIRLLARIVGQLDDADILIDAYDKIGKWYA